MGKRAIEETVRRWLALELPAILRRRRVSAAYLFGSWGRGEADELSDIDLVIVAQCARPFVERFRDYPELLRAPAGLDLLVYTPEEFERERGRNRFLRHVLRRAQRVI